MPAVRPPNNNAGLWTPSWNHYQPRDATAHIYLALAVIAALVSVRCLIARRHLKQHPVSSPAVNDNVHQKDTKHKSTRQPPRSPLASRHGSQGLVALPVWARDYQEFQLGSGRGRKPGQATRDGGIFPLQSEPQQLRPCGKPHTMDGIDGEQRHDHHAGLGASRAVSINPSPRVVIDHTPAPEGRISRSSRASSRTRPGKPYNIGSDEADDHTTKGEGKMFFEGYGSPAHGFQSVALGEDASATRAQFDSGQAYPWPLQGPSLADISFATPRQFPRPPQPAPLTLPNLDGTAFSLQERRPSSAVSIPPALDTSFIHKPNPEYFGSTTSADALSSSPQSATAIPRRRSYTKSVPIGILVPATTSASSSTDTPTSGATFSPSSYPPPSPLLPPPPPPTYQFVGGPGGPGVFLSQEEIDVHGEIISVMDDAGHGWKRHTRVYGGGVCLACLAAGEEGGFYGDTVPLEDRR